MCTLFIRPTEGGKRRRGTKKATLVVGLILNTKGHPQYAKIQRVPNVQGKTLRVLTEKTLKSDTMIHTDGFSSYQVLSGRWGEV
ncbi:transposase [Sporolactobacillus sp. STSJ-5]|uniref:transposase n=1 Tax=Sporolactobacillus sp. STSJ-5 TaxID=2965076 RepID=UPI00351D68B0